MYVRLSVPVFKTLFTNGDIKKEVLAKYTIKASVQHKRDDLYVTITNSKSAQQSSPELEKLRRWYKRAPVLPEFTITESFAENLIVMGLVSEENLRSKYHITVKDMVPDPEKGQDWWPFSIWYFKKAA